MRAFPSWILSAMMILLAFALVAAPVAAADQTIQTRSDLESWTAPGQTTSPASDSPQIEASYPVALAPALQSEAACLIDADTGQILYGKNMDETLYPASITKVMTSLLALEKGQLTDMLNLSQQAVFSVERGSSHIALDVGEQISLKDALYALAIASANDAANGIAEHISGSVADFAVLMNERAAEAGALHTHFSNANGLPDPTHVTTARDMALITRAAYQTPGWITFFSTSHYVIPPTNLKAEERAMYAANSFVNGERQLEGFLASKTGYTTEAQHTLVTVARRNGRTLIAVVMKSELKSAKWDDTCALMDYGFNQFRAVTLQPEAFPGDQVILTDAEGETQTATLAVQKPVTLYLHQSVKTTDLDLTLQRPSNPTADDLNRTTLKITLGSQFSDRMAPELMTLKITPQISKPATGQAAAAASGTAAAETKLVPEWLSVVLIILATVGLLLLAVILYLIRQREKRRRHRRERLAQLRRDYQNSQIRYR